MRDSNSPSLSLFDQVGAGMDVTGDDLGTTFMQVGDVIYGDFASVVNHTDSTAALITYRG